MHVAAGAGRRAASCLGAAAVEVGDAAAVVVRLGPRAHLAEAVPTLEVSLGEEELHARRLSDVLLQVADLHQVIHVQEGTDRREQDLQLPLYDGVLCAQSEGGGSTTERNPSRFESKTHGLGR